MRQRLLSQASFILILASAWIELAYSNACASRQASECGRAFHRGGRLLCGDYILRIPASKAKTEEDSKVDRMFLELPHTAACDIKDVAISDSFEVHFSNFSTSSRWSISYQTLKGISNSSFILFTTSKEAIHKKDQHFLNTSLEYLSYVSQDLTIEFYKALSSKSMRGNGSGKFSPQFKPEKTSPHSLEITFNVTGDREMDKFALNRHWLIAKSTRLHCVKWNGGWTREGCRTVDWSFLKVTCDCDFFHDNETIRMGVLTMVESLSDSVPAMPIYVGLTVISTLFFAATLVLFLRFRKGLRDPNRRYEVQVNLTVSLLLRHTFLLTGFAISLFDPLNRKGCEAMAVLHSYFLITSVLWVLTEGVIIHRKVCKSSLSQPLFGLIINAVLVWGLPFLLVAGVSAFGLTHDTDDSFVQHTESYRIIEERIKSVTSHPEATSGSLSNFRKYDFCWTTSEFSSLAIGIPVTVSLVVNIVILVWVGIVVWKIRVADSKNTPAAVQSANTGTLNQTKATFRAVVLLTAILGIPWLFSLFYNLIEGIVKKKTLAVSYVHFAFTFLQGPALFYLYCVHNHEFRRVYQRSLDSQKLKKSLGSQQIAHHPLHNQQSV